MATTRTPAFLAHNRFKAHNESKYWSHFGLSRVAYTNRQFCILKWDGAQRAYDIKESLSTVLPSIVLIDRRANIIGCTGYIWVGVRVYWKYKFNNKVLGYMFTNLNRFRVICIVDIRRNRFSYYRYWFHCWFISFKTEKVINSVH